MGLHRVRPTWSRAVPDLSSDRNGACEHKLAVPGYAQLDGYSCGATAGWAVVKTFDPLASFRSFYRACNPSLDGTTDPRVIRAVRGHGVGVSVRHDLTYAKIRPTILAKFPINPAFVRGNTKPVIILWSSTAWVGIPSAYLSVTGHGVVVVGRNSLELTFAGRGLPGATDWFAGARHSRIDKCSHILCVEGALCRG